MTAEAASPMTLKLPGVKLVPVSRQRPGGRVELADIQAKLGEIQGEVDETAERNKPVASTPAWAAWCCW